MRISDWSSDVCSSDLLATGVSGEQFTRTLTVDNAAKLKVGDVVQLQWFSVDGPKSQILKSSYGDTDLPIGSHHWTPTTRPLVVLATRVAAIVGLRVKLGDHFTPDMSADPPEVGAVWQPLTKILPHNNGQKI